MMNLLFIHDHPFYEDYLNVYSGGSFPAEVWNNYLSSFQNIKVIGRKSNDMKDKKVLSSGDDRVSFYLIHRYSSIKDLFLNFRKINQQIKELILLNNLVIIRLPSILGVIAGYIAIRNKIPFVIELVGNAREALVLHGSLLGKIAAPVFDYLNKKIVNRSRYVIYVTERKLQIDYPSHGQTESISNVILPLILRREDVNINRFNDDKISIALIGGFDTRYKGQDILLKSISILPTHVKKNIKIYLIGKGNCNWIIEEAKKLFIIDNIEFIGSKARDEIFEFLKHMSLYVQPSFTEGLPRAMLEAMSVGCPVLASSVGGIPDILDQQYLHKAKDFKALSKQILYFYENRDLLREASSENLEKALPYLKENLNKKRLTFFQSVINDINEISPHPHNNNPHLIG
ncbi:glycosyltransferase [Viscerimonas tarda]